MIGCAQVVAIAHRGEHLHHPENTMAAYAEAVRLGVDFFEVDVRTSADGKLVLSHDATVERCTNGKGAVSSLAFAQLRALDAGGGQRIPTFEEALQLAREGGRGVYVDWKEARAAELVRQISAQGMAERVVIYCGVKQGLEVRALNPRMKLMPEAESVTRAREIVERLRPPVIAFDARDFTAEIIAVAKRAGAKVYVDRMGETDGPAGWQAAIDSGADGIQTDRPGELVEYLRSHGYKKSP
jgi:glycerophosphoryl diester phosphodiesterase